MDKWKRNGNVLYNDDEIGYENAKKRIEKMKEKKNKEIENKKLIDDISELKEKVSIMWRYLQLANIIPKNL